MRFVFRIVGLALTIAAPWTGAAAAMEFEVPSGFEVNRYAGDELAHNIFSMTVDSHGRIVVSGPGYVKILHDDTGDGRADRVTEFSPLPRTGAHGMVFDGNDLIATGDGTIFRLRDINGDGVADSEPEVLRMNMNQREHGTHAIMKGPDGWFYVIKGNNPSPDGFYDLAPHSAVADPDQGALLRLSPDFQKVECIAHGFRNPYDIDFHFTGRIFTFDADGERVHHLPGYAPNRLYDIAIGEHHGWMIRGGPQSWSRPAYYFDNVARSVEVGRGSPTGVTFYRHRQFPERYQRGVFAACWSFGWIYFFPLAPDGSSFVGRSEIFMRPKGNEGFAPVATAVGPDGDLFVAIGGRGTRGGVYRIRYAPSGPVEPVGGPELHRVLAADEPLSSWSRARWMPLARKLGRAVFEDAVVDERLSFRDRIRAVEILVEVFGGVTADGVGRVSATASPLVRARLAWALSRGPLSDEAFRLLFEFANDSNVIVQRAAWEALVTLPPADARLNVAANFPGAFSSADRRVRSAAIAVARRQGFSKVEGWREDEALAIARLRLIDTDALDAAGRAAFLENCLRLFQGSGNPAIRLDAVRLMQIGLGDLLREDGGEEGDKGYVAVAYEQVPPVTLREIARVMSAAFPAQRRELDIEVSRLLGMVRAEGEEVLDRLVLLWTEDSAPDDDIHYLLVAVQLPGPRSSKATALTARAFTRLHRKMDARQWLPSRFWPSRVAEAFERISEVDPGLPRALIDAPGFGDAEHSLFATAMTGVVQEEAVRRLMASARDADASDAWTVELVELAASVLSPEEALPELRPLMDDLRLRDAVALALAAYADPIDRGNLIRALDSGQPAVVEAAARALAGMAPGAADEIVVVLKALARNETSAGAASALGELLVGWTGIDGSGEGTRYTAWLDWFVGEHPEHAGQLQSYRSADLDEVLERLPRIDWSQGDPVRGAAVYQQRACAVCHDGHRRMGPSLTGIASRFSREDLFAHIVDPNLAISPTYRAVEVVMRDGRVLVGAPVYQSAAATILETGPGTTIRLTGEDMVSIEPARVSTMPEGLLTGLTDEELADFYAYLRTLR